MIIRDVSWAANQHIRITSEGSCGTEDLSNEAENSALTSQEKITFKKIGGKKISSQFWKINNFSQYYCFNCIFECRIQK